jgi:hypothetical protein
VSLFRAMVATGLLGAIAGCGRFGFDSPRGRGDAPGDDADETDVADAPPDAPTICHTGAWGTPQPIAATVTGSEEADPWISPDERTLVFDSNRSTSNARAIWVTTRATPADAFGVPMRIAELDDATDDYDPTLSADGTVIIFGSLRSGTRQFWRATRADVLSSFVVDAAPITINGDTVIPRTAPDLTPDGLGLYYGRDLEVAFASRPDTATDFTFVREIDEVNVPSTDGGPSVTDDGLELFFDSYRVTDGGVFTATRADTASNFGTTTELTELVDMIPTATGAGSPEISADGRTLYFWAKVGAGQLDLYTSTRTCN